MKYSESQGEIVFDWNDFLEKKRRSEKEWKEAAWLSHNWVTCACGNQCVSIPRSCCSGEPTDYMLSDLGIDFHDNILRRNVSSAIAILKEIEKRSAELLSQNKIGWLEGAK